jgi:hypothetical protein
MSRIRERCPVIRRSRRGKVIAPLFKHRIAVSAYINTPQTRRSRVARPARRGRIEGTGRGLCAEPRAHEAHGRALECGWVDG